MFSQGVRRKFTPIGQCLTTLRASHSVECVDPKLALPTCPNQQAASHITPGWWPINHFLCIFFVKWTQGHKHKWCDNHAVTYCTFKCRSKHIVKFNRKVAAPGVQLQTPSDYFWCWEDWATTPYKASAGSMLNGISANPLTLMTQPEMARGLYAASQFSVTSLSPNLRACDAVGRVCLAWEQQVVCLPNASKST